MKAIDEEPLSPRAGASGNETRVASVRNPKSKIENPNSCVGPSAILTGSRTRPSDWGSNARFGPEEDRRNNRRLATFTGGSLLFFRAGFLQRTRPFRQREEAPE
jgi:hypothetical protein